MGTLTGPLVKIGSLGPIFELYLQRYNNVFYRLSNTSVVPFRQKNVSKIFFTLNFFLISNQTNITQIPHQYHINTKPIPHQYHHQCNTNTKGCHLLPLSTS